MLTSRADRVVFHAQAHRYTMYGKNLPSVTQICRFLAYDYKTDKPWLSKAAAERGTVVHEACALIDYDETPEELPQASGYLKAYRRFLKEFHPQWELIEYPMGSTGLGFAGTLDRYGTLGDGCTCLLDIKTGQLHNAALQAQLTGYSLLLEDEREIKPEALYALQLHSSGTFELRRVLFDLQLFKACLCLHISTEKSENT